MSGVTIITIDNPPVNATSSTSQWPARSPRASCSDPEISAVVIIGAGKTLSQARHREFDKPLRDPQMPAVIEAIEACAKPWSRRSTAQRSAAGSSLRSAATHASRRGTWWSGSRRSPSGSFRAPGHAAAPAPGRHRQGDRPRLHRAPHRCPGGAEAGTHRRHCRGRPARGRRGSCRRGDGQAAAPRPRRSARRRSVDQAACRQVLESQGDSVQVREGIAAVRAAALPYSQAMAREREVFQRLRGSDEAAALRGKFFARKART